MAQTNNDEELLQLRMAVAQMYAAFEKKVQARLSVVRPVPKPQSVSENATLWGSLRQMGAAAIKLIRKRLGLNQ